ncbi:C-GCAxxG-C-C family protein [Acetivibrio clariflavus]|uniref:C_GCAxxG_C_C family probable redox protein n=1 Tax=Acetivibrio clariflavus (strain DSM 19732 / NBRC 101661 / EBR45) TaxID=720554 RepID=G8LV96_ACECE|nr:C-GCAxxG-C-C family protein [Acetivibrio clariflavus]AEV67450.1 C_GCAxxG_C_C family probable redox protein [Acetivibrio clariflavus DSM 19732]HOQ01605.1 C-GCAxxG-C-C family protein [Acetivibrio clariflavus]HPU42277.1 C-GCAxxG-C-C family protein [Acetivibrio clariflavus]
MSAHSDLAKELFQRGYNCSQAVLAAFCDETGLDFDTAVKISSPFGGGIGKLREVCGTVTGMLMVIGMKYGYTDPKNKEAKTEHYELVQNLAKQFEKDNGSIVCRELLGLSIKNDSPVPEDRNESYYKKRPCAELVEQAAKLLDEYIQGNKME